MKCMIIAVLAAGSSLLLAESDAPKRLDVAASTFKEVMGIPDKSIPQDLLNKAQCIIVVPDLKKGAFIIGGKYGKGFVSCRKKDGVGWSAPGSIRVEGGSIGLQIRGSATPGVRLAIHTSSRDSILWRKF